MTLEYDRWEPVIGLEVHLQLNTRSKAFCRCRNSYGDEPNTHVCPVCLGYPGALPVLNEAMVDAAIRLGTALGATIHTRTRFARKHYHYPDLPKGYQMTQHDTPLCTKGWLPLDLHQQRLIGIQRVHLEEDAGKSRHTENETLVDYNRCGAPLLEVVTAPDLRHPIEAERFLLQLRRLVRALDICDGDMEKGNLRCDANLSLRRAGSPRFGTRTELKNLNSMRNVRRALQYEWERQAALLETGGIVEQETRSWDESSLQTLLLRSKELLHDYRYMTEPDLGTLVVDESHIEQITAALPELPHMRARRYYYEFGIAEEQADRLAADKDLAHYFEQTCRAACPHVPVQDIVAWITGEAAAVKKEHPGAWDEHPVEPAQLGRLLQLVADRSISRSAAQTVFDMMVEKREPPETVVERLGLRQIRDASVLRSTLQDVLLSHPDKAKAYRDGKTGLRGFFIGQAMRATAGRADPILLDQLFDELVSSTGETN
ncbi:Asp-tRNA(Asn)/Glu-tRNA(Gln) amidotransferase subunit GatB [bacterium]|nr:Asp-tRNA(Asn)/Glu-tRNA(Gln) amidotransferase subunit GatB [bacterium]